MLVDPDWMDEPATRVLVDPDWLDDPVTSVSVDPDWLEPAEVNTRFCRGE